MRGGRAHPHPGKCLCDCGDLVTVAGADILVADPSDTSGFGQVVPTPLDVHGSDGLTKLESW